MGRGGPQLHKTEGWLDKVTAGDRAGLQPSRCFCEVVLGRCPQAEMGRAVGAEVRRAKGPMSSQTWPSAQEFGGPKARSIPALGNAKGTGTLDTLEG